MIADAITVATLADSVGGEAVGDASVAIRDVTHDSREARTGSLFVAVRGSQSDGHDYVGQALAAGASAVCVDHRVAGDVPQIVVRDTRAVMARLAAIVHGHPSRGLRVVGVTGTNGKTTVTHILESIVRATGRRSAVLGTVGGRIGDEGLPSVRTTPESTDLQRLFARMVDSGVDVAAIEVSSHALALRRVDETWFTVAAFTNLSQDHLDFHGTMDDYFAAKAMLFTRHFTDKAVVFIDDPWGAKLAHLAEVDVMTVSHRGPADVTVTDVECTLLGSVFTITTAHGTWPMSIGIAGTFNVANAAVAAACALRLGIDTDAILRGLSSCPPVPGRFEAVDWSGGPTVIVDYAHTPDAMAAVIAEARRLSAGQVIAVGGAGGDRDVSKRHAMGVALASADLAILTSDNPRSEPPEHILAAVANGARSVAAASILEEIDRVKAIRAAVSAASEDDVVLILGKGHEQGQSFADRTVPFDDRVEARRALAATRGVT